MGFLHSSHCCSILPISHAHLISYIESHSQRLLRSGVPHKYLPRTYERRLVRHGRQDVVEDEQQHGDGEQHGDLEAQFLPVAVRDEEGGQVQAQEEEDGQQEVDDVQQGSPLDDKLEGEKGAWLTARLPV